MGRPHCVAPLRTDQSPHRAADGYWVTRGLDGAKAHAAIGIRAEFPAQVHVRLFGILVLVVAVGRRMPDIDLGIGNWLASFVAYPPRDEYRVPRGLRSHDRPTLRRQRGTLPPEGSLPFGLGSSLSRLAVVHQASEPRHPKGSGCQHDFVVGCVGQLACIGAYTANLPVLRFGNARKSVD